MPAIAPKSRADALVRKRPPGRVFLVFLFFLSVSYAAPHDDIVDLFASMTAALSEANAPAFLKAFDPKMSGYDDLKRQINGLVLDYGIASSVDPIRDEGQGTKRSVDVDWYIELTSLTATGPTRHRRQVVHCDIELQGKHWRIIALKPISFFSDKAE